MSRKKNREQARQISDPIGLPWDHIRAFPCDRVFNVGGATQMNPTTPLKVTQHGYYIGDDDRHLGDKTNIVELHNTRIIKETVHIAMQVRGYEPHLLNQRDDGWYICDLFLGHTLAATYMHIIKFW